jgi:oligopeptide/dipeptide ABC transporter ATP-binding protein
MNRSGIFVDVRNLDVSFGRGGAYRAVRGVSFAVETGKTLCLVGESGSGKSVTATAIMGLHNRASAHIRADALSIGGVDILSCGERELSRLRGTLMSMIFQDPMSCLNPALTIGYQLKEALTLHESVSSRAAEARVLEILKLVRIPEPERRMLAYPHHLSGGMRQRIMIAMALICRPRLLIADEPTTALDVTVQAQILWLLSELQREFGTTIIFITHDLGVVAEIADDVAVMYAGSIVELGSAMAVFDRPSHGYTVGLLDATADIGKAEGPRGRLAEIPGTVPRFDELGIGCSFEARCRFAAPSCRDARDRSTKISHTHWSACDQLVRAAAARPLPIVADESANRRVDP